MSLLVLGSQSFSMVNLKYFNVLKANRRHLCTTIALLRNPSQPTFHKHDLMGPPNPVSNLRPVSFHIPEHESRVEQEFRETREQVQKWNEAFWSKHNTSFVKERDAFAASITKKEAAEIVPPTAEEMSIFYKEFLDKNWRLHLTYNFEWYKKNIHLAFLASKVKIYSLSMPRKK